MVWALIIEAWNDGFGTAKSGCPFTQQQKALDDYLQDVELPKEPEAASEDESSPK